ncbi:uncharacterized conserved protein [Hahella chejuensis KCTC 2396]|uniref:Uncharacterized conserved protein n=1 Tax=Hahella chejuensis (strain KCTC 2396) TaxID=349521 RepID=Q2SNA6_HAHCH|nr:circularly permuted type 2 ATP-grasp protein [Hahella chejuensis]ABC27868.1 uncharacterized conserved protein [Hahella chejuensis KCTC 2396]
MSENIAPSSQPSLDLTGLPYSPLATAFDEMLGSGGEVRPHWRAFADYFSRVSRDNLGQLRRDALRRLKEQGVNYHVYDDPQGMRRTWQLDPLPMVMSEADWSPIETGLQQRAHLFSRVLADLLGPQTCLKQGVLPPELVLQHPGFLRSMMGSAALPLSLFAADLARGPDGAWWVLADRTQGPSGAGYVLEARMVTKRVLSQNAVDYAIAPLAQFFYHFKRHVAALAPDQQKEPTIVLLSPGIGNEVYFEHAYLAAQLGITLVQGDDLTVRQGKVYLKTVDDLQQVDVIIRRVDDAFCDPLNFRADSMLGVPGLAQAQALGRVGMANPLGGGFLESPAMLPFLPALSKHFLAEELKLPNVATWWCGQEKELKHVLQNLDDLVIKTVDRHALVRFGPKMSARERDALKRRIQAEPWRYVGQELLSFSTTPTLVGSEIQPRHLVLRGFAAGDGEQYDVMPGGLTRVSPDAHTFLVSSQSGGWSKDTWLLKSSGSMRDVLRLSPTKQRRIASAVLTSRAAENLFWLARYLERTESLLRHIRAYVRRLENYIDYGFDTDKAVLEGMLPAVEAFCSLDREGLPTVEDLKQYVLDSSRIGGVAFNLRGAINSAYTVRDLWSGDCWRAVEELEELLEYSEKNRSVLALDQFIQPFLTALLAFLGASQESLALNQGGLWLQLGRRLERAQNTLSSTHKICAELNEDNEAGLREMLLEAHDCLSSHRRRYGTELPFYTLWKHLLLEPTNPRSLVYAVSELEPLLSYLNPTPQQGLIGLEKNVLAILTPLRLADAVEWRDLELTQTELAPFLQNLTQQLNQFGLNIEHQYFKHAQPLTRFMR